MSRDFRLQVFFVNQFPPKPLSIPLRPFQICSKTCCDIGSSRCTTGVVTGGNRKNLQKGQIFIILFWYLWVVELTYRYIFYFRFTVRCKQSDIVPIICHWCQRHRWFTLTCEYLREYLKKIKMILMLFSGEDGSWKKSQAKNLVTLSPLTWSCCSVLCSEHLQG